MDLLAAVVALGPDWLNPETLLTTLGDIAFWVVLGIIFAECGLLIGFFLPGDSLLFVTGLFIASGYITLNIWVAVVLLIAAAILGNATGYWIGYKVGPALFRRPDSRLFKQEYVDKTHEFFERYGARAIVLARFVPIVRTFITAIAGVARMDFRRYMTYSAIGGVLWAGGVTLAGYYLGTIPWVKDNVEIILIAVVVVSVIPIVIEYWRHKREKARLAAAGGPASAPAPADEPGDDAQASPRSVSE
ncbi:MAG: VTT domain-containing protein [Candidatus Nanopelagicales bacterium]